MNEHSTIITYRKIVYIIFRVQFRTIFGYGLEPVRFEPNAHYTQIDSGSAIGVTVQLYRAIFVALCDQQIHRNYGANLYFPKWAILLGGENVRKFRGIIFELLLGFWPSSRYCIIDGCWYYYYYI